jgi:hypothetical protein
LGAEFGADSGADSLLIKIADSVLILVLIQC